MPLNERYKLILVLSIADTSDTEIAKTTGYSTSSISVIKAAIYKELGAHSLASAAVKGVKKKVISPLPTTPPSLTPVQHYIVQAISTDTSNARMIAVLKKQYHTRLTDTQFRQVLNNLFDLFEVKTKAQLMLRAASCGLV